MCYSLFQIGKSTLILEVDEILEILAWRIHVAISSVIDLQGPPAIRLFTPEVHAEEGPVIETRTENVPWPLEQQGRCGAHWRGEQ